MQGYKAAKVLFISDHNIIDIELDKSTLCLIFQLKLLSWNWDQDVHFWEKNTLNLQKYFEGEDSQERYIVWSDLWPYWEQVLDGEKWQKNREQSLSHQSFNSSPSIWSQTHIRAPSISSDRPFALNASLAKVTSWFRTRPLLKLFPSFILHLVSKNGGFQLFSPKWNCPPFPPNWNFANCVHHVVFCIQIMQILPNCQKTKQVHAIIMITTYLEANNRSWMWRFSPFQFLKNLLAQKISGLRNIYGCLFKLFPSFILHLVSKNGGLKANNRRWMWRLS